MNNALVFVVLFVEALIVAFIIGVVANAWWMDQAPDRRHPFWSRKDESVESIKNPSP